ncbi:phosphatidylinositol-specific phospholipase C/glycerophosphodiester phosphodiesterase family protein [Saccharopolyspora dendranthemae]|uniref:Altered inheritance of mitochondria protein 6 n=1 Tax=Saccharopolyspora dendranthemae TaxID=1181886 RepID=A0A561VBE4_9PSEU|nr:phosphatidylinositol-specific phospholipase C/glycerophosphodiester phosphodiesterase family protein [Saccharopolyspora dendranthemae]TWG08867.1 glycerophosphoryl diester phosphodiesterase family protein [Saccharopolyspora dendranthemae]
MRSLSRFLLPALAALTLIAPAAASAAPALDAEPLAQAHAHNDYLHDRPLLDALDHGFTSVEADIYPLGDSLLVGHDPFQLRPDRTIESLYLDPLVERVNADGLYPGHDVKFQLLVDFKTFGEDGYKRFDEIMRDPRYAGLFTHYENGTVTEGPVTVVISGEKPTEFIEGQTDRYAFLDGGVGGSIGADPALVPLVSDDWTQVFSWNGSGDMPADERDELERIVGDAHAAGQRVRFWATPDDAGAEREAVWKVLEEVGVDHINTDDLAGLQEFLSN